LPLQHRICAVSGYFLEAYFGLINGKLISYVDLC
jgi:hypothetical protein